MRCPGGLCRAGDGNWGSVEDQTVGVSLPTWTLLQPLAAGTHSSAWSGDMLRTSPATWGVPVPCQTLGSDPLWGQTSLLFLGGRWVLCAHPLSPYPKVLPQHLLGLQGGIYLISLNKRQ